MESKDKYLLRKLGEKGKLDYTQEQFKRLKELFIDNIIHFKMDREQVFEDAYKTVFRRAKCE